MVEKIFDKYCVHRKIDGSTFEVDPVYATSFDNAEIVLKQQKRNSDFLFGKFVHEIILTEEELNTIANYLKDLENLENLDDDEDQ